MNIKSYRCLTIFFRLVYNCMTATTAVVVLKSDFLLYNSPFNSQGYHIFAHIKTTELTEEIDYFQFLCVL